LLYLYLYLFSNANISILHSQFGTIGSIFITTYALISKCLRYKLTVAGGMTSQLTII
jgi:hypothetical protein